MPHGTIVWERFDPTYERFVQDFADYEYEGFVWWFEGHPVAKIKRRDFGFPWPPSSPEEPTP